MTKNTWIRNYLWLVLIGVIGVGCIVFVILSQGWSGGTFTLINDLPYTTLTGMHVSKQTIFYQGPRSYFVPTIRLESGNRESVFSAGKDICISLGKENNDPKNRQTFTTSTWFELRLPFFKNTLALSELSKYAHAPCVHDSLYRDEYSSSSSTITAPTSTKSNNSIVSGKNTFDVLKNKPGDMIAGMKLLTVAPMFDSGPLSNQNVRAEFQGQATLTGNYDFSYSDFAGEDMVCANSSDKEKLPLLTGVENPFFCFTNLDLAKKIIWSILYFGYRDIHD